MVLIFATCLLVCLDWIEGSKRLPIMPLVRNRMQRYRWQLFYL